jgi:hypothetical protein
MSRSSKSSKLYAGLAMALSALNSVLFGTNILKPAAQSQKISFEDGPRL